MNFKFLILILAIYCNPLISNEVKVAAIQTYSILKETDKNKERIIGLIKKAAENGAKIIVTPECSLTGYADLENDIFWTSAKTKEDGYVRLEKYAIHINDEIINEFRQLSDQLNIYLSISFAEKDKKKYFNSQILIDPKGKLIGHHRKQNLWTSGDTSWVTKGDREVQVINTEFGKIGLMICYDAHLLAEKMGDLKADIVLYSVGWYGPNSRDWFHYVFSEKYVIPNKINIVAANWSAKPKKHQWKGSGISFIMDKNGKVHAEAKTKEGSEILYSNFKISKSKNKEVKK